VTEIAIYIEGGGTTVDQKASLRRGFDELFKAEKLDSGKKRVSLKFVFCGGRGEAYDTFRNAVSSNPERINALLVDSETSISAVPADKKQDPDIRVKHLGRKEGTDGRGQGDAWDLSMTHPDRVHLMVQCMETWIVSDPETLEKFYGQGFKSDKLPKRPNLEDEPKKDVNTKLESATKETQKGVYAKLKHASEILQMVDPSKVAKRCPRFKLFQEWLALCIQN
jgi:hypothetical protein